MRALANENFPAPSTTLLRQTGWEIRSIKEDMPGVADREVIEVAVKENRVILTFDRDYGELLFRYQHKPPPAVVYFCNKGTMPESAARILLKLLQETDIVLTGNFTVVEETGIRQRKL